MTKLRFYSGDDLVALSDPLAMVAAVEAAIVAADDVAVPDRLHIENEASTLLVMPAVGNGQMLVKCVTVAPANPSTGLPLVHGLAMLIDERTGIPLAVFDAAQLTAQRTGALAAIALKNLTDPGLDRLGLVGTGEQARWIALHAAAIRPLTEIICLTRSHASFQRFSAALGPMLPGVAIRRVPDAAVLLDTTSCVVTATTSSVPVLPDAEHALLGKTLISIGSFTTHAQELPDAAYRLARTVVVDCLRATTEVGDLIGPLERGVISRSDIVTAADLLAGRHPALEATRVFKSVGFAAFDLFAASDIHRRGQKRNMGQEITA